MRKPENVGAGTFCVRGCIAQPGLTCAQVPWGLRGNKRARKALAALVGLENSRTALGRSPAAPAGDAAAGNRSGQASGGDTTVPVDGGCWSKFKLLAAGKKVTLVLNVFCLP